MSARPRLGRRGAIMLGALLLALVAFIASSQRAKAPPPVEAADARDDDLLGRIPAGAFVVADVDVATLRQTELGREVFGGERDVAGLGRIADVCGFDPVAELRRVALVVPQLGDVGFGLFGDGPLDQDEVLACADAIVRRRGGRPERGPRGRFVVLRDPGLGASAAALAVAPGGPLMLGEPAYLEQVLAVESGAPALSAQGPHRRLRTLVPPGIVVATVVFGPSQRRTLAEELRAQGMPESPLTSLREAALSLTIDRELRLEAVVGCATPSACAELAQMVRGRRADLQADPRVRILGLASVVEAATITVEGPRIRVALRVPVATVLDVLRRLQLLQRLEEVDLPAVPASAAPPAPSTPPVGAASGGGDGSRQ